MTVADKLIDACEKLPGFYGYRPSMKEHEIIIDELQFRLTDKDHECEYFLRIYLNDHTCVDADIDAHYSDGSIARVHDHEETFSDIINHKNKLIASLNRFL